ncbi:TQXA domain-containing protein [Actinoalloteichus sp. AHMU CJ021]|uniref:LPXTG-motif cell wall anchor domain-containing protein/TQXA domain-containing protein n=1 Tax=Actinoalloteichus caeruleus DSM 43889 TaxID=1120930 RepID=A0ABT1JJV0_ACTCY|nr:Cys-Gln thioester bond-forming surface protein [Actinoalloteichus caeruleus]AUS78650.1 TQXA domain-containing protein [Actinoalloteichus sp. AHMU CJ021]MCP2332787.1 LPXTG-motif cell wall anchor domain-containing protein/TQXA domain-containing protein [Actinoalloteichus caeruleus DSM 43889]
MRLGLRLARAGAALLGAAALLVGTALPAAASTKGHYDNTNEVKGERIHLTDRSSVPTVLLPLVLEDGTELLTYCVELTVTAANKAPYHEVPWDQYPTDQNASFPTAPGKVLWILQNSYPQVSVDELNAQLGTNLNVERAVAGTQAAIWHFSNGSKLAGNNGRDIQALYRHLTGEANVGVDQQPTPTLALSPESHSGAAGELIGPFTVESSAGTVGLALQGPEGVTLVNKNGEEVNPISGDVPTDSISELYVSVPEGAEAGEATITANASATVNTGRLFVGDPSGDWSGASRNARDSKRTQSLIVAEGKPTNLDTSVRVDWVGGPVAPPTSETPEPSVPETPQPSEPAPSTTPSVPEAPETTTPAPPAPERPDNEDDLANTGASIWLPLGLGAVLLGGGATALFLMRRKKQAEV